MYGFEFNKKLEIAQTIMARDYKGFGRQAQCGTGKHQSNIVYDSCGVSPTICASFGVKQPPTMIIDSKKSNKDDDWTWNVEGNKYLIRIRKITPREAWRLMDFSDEDFNNAQSVCSDTQLFKQAGNAIVKNCLCEIFKMFF